MMPNSNRLFAKKVTDTFWFLSKRQSPYEVTKTKMLNIAIQIWLKQFQEPIY